MKNFFFLIPLFVWLQACSQSPTSSNPTAQAILTDTTGKALGNSLDYKYRLFQFNAEIEGKPVMVLKALRLGDLQEAFLSNVSPKSQQDMIEDPKFFWSKDSKYLIVENSVPDSAYEREVVLFNLINFQVERRIQGQLLGFDQNNGIAFLYRYNPERQLVAIIDLKSPAAEKIREIIAAPDGQKAPTFFVNPQKRDFRIKVYTEGGAAANASFEY